MRSSTCFLILGLMATGSAMAADMVNIPMDQQINIGLGDAIYSANNTPPNFLSFHPADPANGEPEGWARQNIKKGNDWYYGPYINFRRAGIGDVDFTKGGCATTLEVDVRYFQGGGNVNPYGDAPIKIRAYTSDAAGTVLGYRDFDWMYMTQRGDPPYPAWTHVKMPLNNSAEFAFTEGSVGGGVFDPTKISHIRFYGTDWAGRGDDFVDVKNFVIYDDLRVSPNLDREIAYPGVQYKRRFFTSICTTPPDVTITWSKLSGPEGLTIDAKGNVAWTPTVTDVGNIYTVEIQATNGTDTLTESFEIEVLIAPPIIREVTPDPAAAYADWLYVRQLGLVQGTAPIAWSVVQGPAGLTVSNSGVVSGWTPSAGDIGKTVTIEIKAENSSGSDTETWQVQVNAAIAGDDIAPPWGTVAANLSGTQSSADPALTLNDGWAEGAKIDWLLDAKGAGLAAPNRLSRISFDEAGNLYWKTGDGFLASVSPIGAIRWTGQQAGAPVDLGAGDDSTPVVGDGGPAGSVYVTSDAGIAAFAKDTGELLWQTALPAADFSSGGRLTPALYQGRLYVVGAGPGEKGVYVVRTADGGIELAESVAGFDVSAGGQMAMVPDAFGPNAHGLYFNASSGDGDGKEMYAVKASLSEGISLAWAADGGKVARSHVIHLEAEQRVCTHTWGDFGGTLYCWNLDGTAPAATGNKANNSGHGFEDLGAVDFDGNDILAGAFDGRIVRYLDVAEPEPIPPPTEVLYDTGGFETYALGSIVGQDAWQDDTNSPAYGPAQIVDDPTGTGKGKVMQLDPQGPAGGWQGAFRPFLNTRQVVSIEWDQWRTALTDTLWYADMPGNYTGWWAFQPDNGSGATASQGGNPVPVKSGAWQHVRYIIDLAHGQSVVEVDGAMATGGTADLTIDGVDFQLELTEADGAAGPTYIDNLIVKQADPVAEPAFAGNGFYQMQPTFYENRGNGALYKNQSGASVVVTGTSGTTQAGNSYIAAIDVTNNPLLTTLPQDPQPLLFTWDTGTLANPVGGPILGPAVEGVPQHIYYFRGDTGELVALTYIPPIPGDYDKDRDVDIDDLPAFVACVSGPAVPYENTDCRNRDFDKDQDVDQEDFGIFQRCFSGANIEGNPDCAN